MTSRLAVNGDTFQGCAAYFAPRPLCAQEFSGTRRDVDHTEQRTEQSRLYRGTQANAELISSIMASKPNALALGQRRMPSWSRGRPGARGRPVRGLDRKQSGNLRLVAEGMWISASAVRQLFPSSSAGIPNRSVVKVCMDPFESGMVRRGDIGPFAAVQSTETDTGHS